VIGLDDLVRAARDVGGAGEEEAAETRRRVLVTLASRSRFRTRAPAGLLLIAAVVGGGAWAATPSFRHAFVAAATEAEAPPAPRAVAAPPRAAKVVVAAVSQPRASASGSSVAQPLADARGSETHDAHGAAVDALYGAAHQAHFVERDYAKALAAWDRYLAVAPKDPHDGFVLEARYNRAICLIRLGRRDEGRAAVEPFANGAYRSDDARSLLDALK
jgi:hypothetical protein